MDSGYTPQLLISAGHSGVSLPFDQIEIREGEVILNVHEQAVSGFAYEDGRVEFKTRFAGRSFDVSIPFDAVIAVFTRETQEGLHLRALAEAESSIARGEDSEIEAAQAESQPIAASGKPHLTLVK